MTAEVFLRDYWQRRPLLVRGAMPGFTSPLTPGGLAALAAEDDVSARLILEEGGEYPWELLHGPFEEGDFEALPESHWTLLVQEVDRHVPAVAALLEAFRFIPNWRIDDVMVSFAPAHGGVGAHIDNYDVFLLQGLGHRRWRINHTPVHEERLVPDLDVSILADFEADAEWVLEPGDLLYLPPRIAHYGVALDDCMTYSIGFRAPAPLDLADGFVAHLAESCDPRDRYTDPGLPLQEHPGEITPEALAGIRAALRGLLTDDAALDQWFGRFVTEPRRGLYGELPDEPYTPRDLAGLLADGAALQRSALADFAFIRHPDGTATLFAAGRAYPLEQPLAFAAPLLTGPGRLDRDTMAPHLSEIAFLDLLAALLNEGALHLENGD